MLFRLSLVVISLIRVYADIFSDEDNLLQLKCPAESTDCFNEDDHRFPVLSEMIQSALALHEYKFQRFDQTVLRASPESRVYVMFQQSTGWVKDQTKQNGYYSGLMDAYYEARDRLAREEQQCEQPPKRIQCCSTNGNCQSKSSQHNGCQGGV